MATLETHAHDVLVIGAGGAGLRAAIEAKAAGADVGLVCKSLLGKAHTVMAEGGVAAALGNVAAADSWRSTSATRWSAASYLNNPRMAELHATGGARPRPRARAVGRRLRPDAGRPDPPAPVRRPLASAAGARRRPDRARDDPHAPGPGRRARHRRSTWSAPITRLVTGPARGHRRRSATGGRRASRSSSRAKPIVLATGGIGTGVRGHLELVGVQRRRPGARLRGRRRAHRHGVRPVPPDRDGLAARACAACS